MYSLIASILPRVVELSAQERMQSGGFKVWGLGFRVQDAVWRFQGLGFRV